ncbi:putative prophage CPS-53 integrase [compost metagenome]
MGKLNPQQVENLAEAGTYEDGDGLRLDVKASGSKSWTLRYQMDGRRREMGLGKYPSIPLKLARQLAADARKLLATGADPLAIRDAERAAKARGLREGDNPARWRGHLANLLSKAEKKNARQRQHFPAMDWRDIPKLMTKLSALPNRDSVAARLLILTGARSHMVRFAQWSEFDLEVGIWSLPAERRRCVNPSTSRWRWRSLKCCKG